MLDGDPRQRNVAALHLRDMRNVAGLLRRPAGLNLALQDPVLIGRAGALLCGGATGDAKDQRDNEQRDRFD
jgi:hypothetical protein